MAAEPKRVAGDDDLPHELWREILTRLPVKSILRCRSVCESWYSLVSCPNFISDYTTRNLNKNDNRILVQLYDCGTYVYSFSSPESFADPFRGRKLYDVPEAFLELFLDPSLGREHYRNPNAFRDTNLQIVGSCNGLICLSKYYITSNDDKSITFTFLIWNPTIHKVVELPSRTFSSSARWKLAYSLVSTSKLVDLNFSYFGFGFDSTTSDYKVLWMCTNSADLNDGFSDMGANVCHIYDSGKGVWRAISPLMHPWKVEHPTSECCLHGALHWTGCRHGKSSDKILLSFNMSDEVFREIRMPDRAEFTGDVGVEDGSIRTRSLAFDGLIHVIMWVGLRFARGSPDCSVWAMKEYGVAESWTKSFSLNLPGASAPSTFLLWKNEEVLMVHDYDDTMHDYDDTMHIDYKEYKNEDEFFLYNTGSRTCKRLSSFDKDISNVCLYEESLFLM